MPAGFVLGLKVALSTCPGCLGLTAYIWLRRDGPLTLICCILYCDLRYLQLYLILVSYKLFNILGFRLRMPSILTRLFELLIVFLYALGLLSLILPFIEVGVMDLSYKFIDFLLMLIRVGVVYKLVANIYV